MTTPPPTERLRLLHLGLGSFHRAHQAVYMHRLMQAGDTRWQCAGANLRPDMADTIAALQRQGGAYTLETVSPQGERRLEKITSITEVIAYEPTLARVLELGADPATRIVSFTVTEAGYALDHHGRAGPARIPRSSATWPARRRSRSTASPPRSCARAARRTRAR